MSGTSQARKWGVQRRAARAIVAVAALLIVATQTGCVAIGLVLFSVGAGIGGGTALNYTLNAYAYRTFTAPLPTVERAASRTMRNMGFQVEQPENLKDGNKILRASGNERKIEVRLEKVSDKTTRMRTVVSEGTFLRDRATATEIILQTEQALAHS